MTSLLISWWLPLIHCFPQILFDYWCLSCKKNQSFSVLKLRLSLAGGTFLTNSSVGFVPSGSSAKETEGSILAKNNRCKGAKMIYRGLTHEFDLAFAMEQLPYFSDCLIGSMTILHVKPDFQIHAFYFAPLFAVGNVSLHYKIVSYIFSQKFSIGQVSRYMIRLNFQCLFEGLLSFLCFVQSL